MKTKIMVYVILLVSIAVTACSTSENCIKSKNELIQSHLELPYFDTIHFKSNGNLFISQGKENSITIEASEKILEKIKTQISGNSLTISCDEELCSDAVKIYVTAEEISSIKSYNKGNIYNITSIKSNSLGVFTNGGAVYLTDLDISVLKVLTNEQSNVKLSGSSKSTLLENQGVGNIDAKDLNSKFLTVNILGSGNVIAYVDYKLTTKISGTGNLTFLGNPYDTEYIRDGLGIVKKLKVDA